MDYYDLILKGYVNTSNRKHFDRYLFRAYKEAEALFFSIDEFFDGCFEVIESLKGSLDTKVNSYKFKYEKELSMLEIAKQLPTSLKSAYISKNKLRDAKSYRKWIRNATKLHGWEEHLIDGKLLKVDYDLIESLNKFILEAVSLAEEKSEISRIKAKSGVVSYRQAGLICSYNQIEIEKTKKDIKILKQFTLNSWDNLYNHFNSFETGGKRRAKPYPYTRVKLDNKIKLFKSVIDFIDEKFRHKIEEDILVLESHMETDFL